VALPFSRGSVWRPTTIEHDRGQARSNVAGLMRSWGSGDIKCLEKGKLMDESLHRMVWEFYARLLRASDSRNYPDFSSLLIS